MAGGFSKPAYQELIHTYSQTNGTHFGVQYLDQGHFNIQSGVGDQPTNNLVISKSPALTLESQVNFGKQRYLII